LDQKRPFHVNLHTLVPSLSTSFLTNFCPFNLHADTQSLLSLCYTNPYHLCRPWLTTSSILTVPGELFGSCECGINFVGHFLYLNFTLHIHLIIVFSILSNLSDSKLLFLHSSFRINRRYKLTNLLLNIFVLFTNSASFDKYWLIVLWQDAFLSPVSIRH